MKTNDGGPAFPWGGDVAGGMTLRDYFAAKALAGMLAYPGNEREGNYNNNASYDEVALTAYTYADAMLRAREVVVNKKEESVCGWCHKPIREGEDHSWGICER